MSLSFKKFLFKLNSLIEQKFRLVNVSYLPRNKREIIENHIKTENYSIYENVRMLDERLVEMYNAGVKYLENDEYLLVNLEYICEQIRPIYNNLMSEV